MPYGARVSAGRLIARYTAWGLGALISFVSAVTTAESPDAAGESKALTAGLVYEGAFFSNLDGGVRSGSGLSGDLNIHLRVDAGTLWGWPDTVAYVDALWLHGNSPGNFVGDAQGVSSISAPDSTKLYEAWVQTATPGKRVSLLAGLYDINSEFYVLQSAGLFLNSSFGLGPEFSQSGTAGPSTFPNTSIGLRLSVKPRDTVVVRAAMLDGVPLDRPDGSRGAFERGDDALLVGEVAILDRSQSMTPSSNRQQRIGRQATRWAYDNKVALGAWYYTASLSDLSSVDAKSRPLQHRGSRGAYVIADRLLFASRAASPRQLTAFIQAGAGDGRVSRFDRYLGVGVTAIGVFDRHSDDELGLAVAHARNGAHYIAARRLQKLPVAPAETSIELTYLRQLSPRLALQPNLQYVRSPNTTPGTPSALVLQLRVEVSF